jgi:hypothetical protein
VNVPPKPQAPIPFPSRLKKDKDNAQFSKFLELIKQLHINLPFVDALSQMPKYAKFLKDLLTNKRKFEELSTVQLGEECSAAVMKKLPEKLNDPGSFTLPCLINNVIFENALADLGASINLMPAHLCEKLSLGELKLTRMCIQLADRSMRYPKGIVQDVLVKIDKFNFPVDFVVLDMDEEVGTPIILGRPFLATARALIDVADGRLVLRVGDEEAIFKLENMLKRPNVIGEACDFIDIIDVLSDEVFECMCSKNVCSCDSCRYMLDCVMHDLVCNSSSKGTDFSNFIAMQEEADAEGKL